MQESLGTENGTGARPRGGGKSRALSSFLLVLGVLSIAGSLAALAWGAYGMVRPSQVQGNYAGWVLGLAALGGVLLFQGGATSSRAGVPESEGMSKHGPLRRAVLRFNGMNPEMVSGAHEATLPTIFCLLVFANGAIAFGSFFVASKVFFDSFGFVEQLVAGLLLGMVVFLIDWMIISWHPVLPSWFISTRDNHGVWLRNGAMLGALAFLILSPGVIWYWSLDLPWHVYLSVPAAGAFAGLIGGWVIRLTPLSKASAAAGVSPSLPGFHERLPNFVIRLLLTALIGAVVGSGLEVAMNREAVQQKRQEIALTEADNRLKGTIEDNYNQKKKDYDENGVELGKLMEERKKLQDDINEGEGKFEALSSAYEEADNRVKLEQRTPGVAGLEAAQVHRTQILAEKNSRGTALEVLRGNLTEITTKINELQGRDLPERESFEDHPRREEYKREALAAAEGLVPTLEAAKELKNEEPMWLAWGPHLAIMIIDLIPALMKLLNGYQPAEQREWQRQAREALRKRRDDEELEEELMAGRVRAAAAVGNRDIQRARTAQELEKIKATFELDLKHILENKQIEWEAEHKIAKIKADDRVAEAEQQSERRARDRRAARSRADDGGGGQSIDDAGESDVTARGVPFSEDVVVDGESYRLGPELGADTRFRVRLGVKHLPKWAESVDTPEVIRKYTAIFKSPKPGSHDGGLTSDDHRGWSGVFRGYQLANQWANPRFRVNDRFIIDPHYELGGDLVTFLQALGRNGRAVTLRELIDCVRKVAEKVVQVFHFKGYAHNDIKASNVLVCGTVDFATGIPADSGGGSPLCEIRLADFDTVRPLGESLPAGTNRCVAPEIMADVANARGTAQTDAFAVGALLFELLSGLKVNSFIDQDLGEKWPPVGSWTKVFESRINKVIKDCVAELPDSTRAVIRKLLTETLHPNPACRPVGEKLLLLFDEALQGIGDAHYVIPKFASVAVDHRSEIKGLFKELGYQGKLLD